MARNRLQFDINAKDKTKRAFSSLKRGLKGVSKAIFNMKTGLAAVAGVAGLGLLIRNSLKSIDKLGKLSRQVFISTEDLSAFRLAADLGGTSLEAFAKGARTLAVGINDWLVKGTGIAQDAFIQLGITQDDLRATNGDLMAQFELVADALRNMEDGTDKTAAAYKLFGGRNIELLTAIERGTKGMQEMADEAKRFGLVLTTEMVASVEAANDSMSRTKSLFTGVSNHFTVALAPAIQLVSDRFRESLLVYIEKTHGSMEEFGNYLGTSLINAIRSMIIWTYKSETTFKNFGISLHNVGVAASNTLDVLKLWEIWDNIKTQKKFKEFKEHVVMDMEEVMQKIVDLDATMFALTNSVGTYADTDSETTNTIVNNNKEKKKSSTELYDFEDLKMKAQLKAFEEHEKKKQEIRKAAIGDIKDNLEGTLTILSGHSAKAFKMLKAHKIAEAIVNTYSAVMRAFATVPYPLNFLAAGSALAFGMAQVQQIRSQKFTPRRQGGLVSENKPYMVGEGGPETFIPNSAGYIAPGVGGQNIGITFNINAVDTAGFQALLANERGMIVSMINSAVNQQGKSNII